MALVGLPGAGKTTLARAMAPRLGARVLDRDLLRHGLFAPVDHTAAERDITFAAMLDAASYHLARGRPVVFDGMTFSRRAQLEAVASVAREADGFSAVIVCDVPTAVAVERCEQQAGGHHATDRDAGLVRRVAEEMDEPEGEYLCLDMTAPVDVLVDQAVVYLLDHART